MATDITKGDWKYPHMNPKDEIVGLKGLAKAMPALYGPNFDSSKYTPLFNNIRTGALMSKPHHCTHNDTRGHKMTRNCVIDGHQTYCLEWITDGGRRVRCGVRFKVVSGGCGAHPANSMENSNNLQVKNLQAERISDTTGTSLNAAKETNQAILAQHDEELAAMDNIGATPMANYSVHIAFEDNKVQKERAEQEQRKIQGNEKESRITRKSKKKKASDDDEDVPPIPEIPQRFGKSNLFKSGQKRNKPDASKWLRKRGGRNASDPSSQE